MEAAASQPHVGQAMWGGEETEPWLAAYCLTPHEGQG